MSRPPPSGAVPRAKAEALCAGRPWTAEAVEGGLALVTVVGPDRLAAARASAERFDAFLPAGPGGEAREAWLARGRAAPEAAMSRLAGRKEQATTPELPSPAPAPPGHGPGGGARTTSPDAEDLAAALDAAHRRLAPDGRLALDAERLERDHARLGLALMVFLRRLTEQQAIRRVERGALTPEKEARHGLAPPPAAARLRAIAAAFDLDEDALTPDLGPLGRLVRGPGPPPTPSRRDPDARRHGP